MKVCAPSVWGGVGGEGGKRWSGAKGGLYCVLEVCFQPLAAVCLFQRVSGLYVSNSYSKDGLKQIGIYIYILTSTPIGAWIVKLEIMTDRPTDKRT